MKNSQDHFNVLRKIDKNSNSPQRKIAEDLGFGLGKLWSSGATKVATRLAQKEAMKAYTKSLTKQGVSKITATETQKKTALKLAEKEWGKVMQSSAIKANNTTVKNRAAKMGVGGSMVEKHAKNMMKKEIIL